MGVNIHKANISRFDICWFFVWATGKEQEKYL